MRRDNYSSSGSVSNNSREDWRRNEWRRGEWRRSESSNTSGNRRSRELAYDILMRFDRDQSRSLDEFERKDLGIDATRFDADGDGSIDGVELYQWIDSQISERIGDLTDVLPEWFFEKDTNQDSQITMAEFTDEWTDELSSQFNAMDTNQDGMITAVELVEARSIAGGTYTSATATLLAPRTTATSSIVIDDEFQIEKLRVQVSITHDYTEQLSLQLIAPNGKQIDLVRGAGGSGDHFEGTIFDDESGERIQRSSAPFRGTYQPTAVERNQPSLSSLIDTSMKGEWKLTVDGSRNQRFGILHSWSLIVVPRKQTSLPSSGTTDSASVSQATN
jgi:subtilisin-like proprotein convertase family protein